MRTTLQPLLEGKVYIVTFSWGLLYISTCVWITMFQGQTISGAYNCLERTTLTPTSKPIAIDSTAEGNHK